MVTTATRGRFVVLEGIDGAGTTTQVARLADRLRKKRSPCARRASRATAPMGTLVRQMLTGRVVVTGGRAPDWATMALLFAADRMDHVESRDRARGSRRAESCISDRYDASSLAYQSVSSGGEGRDAVEWIRIAEQARQAPRSHHRPGCPRRGGRRAARSPRRGAQLYEQNEVQRALAAFYKDLAKHMPQDRVVLIDASGSIEDVHQRVYESYVKAFGETA